MKTEVKKISKDELKEHGLQIIIDSPGDLIVDDITITKDVRDCVVTALAADYEKQKKEWANKIKEGKQKKGARVGRLPIAEEIVKRIQQLRAEGKTSESIAETLNNDNVKISVSTVKKYCKAENKKN